MTGNKESTKLGLNEKKLISHNVKKVNDCMMICTSVYAKTSLSGTMECYHQSTAVDVYARHSQEGGSMNIIICACLA